MKKTITLPLIPLRGLIVFPKVVSHFDVGRNISINAIDNAMLNEQKIFVSAQKSIDTEEPSVDDIYKVGVICKIKQVLKTSDKTLRVLVEGIQRAEIVSFTKNDDKNYISTDVNKITERNSRSEKICAYSKVLKDSFLELLNLLEDDYYEAVKNIDPMENISGFSDMVSSYAFTDNKIKQEILETINIKSRIEKIIERLKYEIELAKIQRSLAEKLKVSLDKEQKEYFLRQQMKVISNELGDEEDKDTLIEKLKERFKKLRAPKNVKEKFESELKRLRTLGLYSSEGNVVLTYLEWILDIPWRKSTKEVIDIKKAKNILDFEHSGLEKIKEKILDYLTVKNYNKASDAPILCLVGPPGVGKSSIASSIAKATNRAYSRISLGGIKDEAEIRGHRRTYVGAIPGRFVYALKEAKSMNPLILLDEIDKIGSENNISPSDALLEALDSKQNNKFRDNYLELPLDLSKVMFIVTANTLKTVPRPLIDRMEIVEVSGYTSDEKLSIAKDHLIPKINEKYKSASKDISISDNAIKKIIDSYTREAGVRDLERKLETIFVKSLSESINKKLNSIKINQKNVEKYLGKIEFEIEKIEPKDKIGVVNGMAWTEYGGDTLELEAVSMTGSGKLELTGKLGDVMQESAKTAFSYVRANAEKYGINDKFYLHKDVHIHAPEGAIPKDGPSAGVGMVTAIVSALSNKKVKHNVAMTGEVTLTGRVLKIGGLKEKTIAAYRSGVDTIIIPKDNSEDVGDIPEKVLSNIKVIKADRVDDVLDNALVD
ncbi:endopeptidase La [Clostridium sp. BJN0001]|uniref:endopeptidase La n=1 Tax=Clostridium sp. BJN0001 TaxID=2930219 RepID=UPI001FD585F4|nr:endopeptidase La [Clostridium sp. BJN0001]